MVTDLAVEVAVRRALARRRRHLLLFDDFLLQRLYSGHVLGPDVFQLLVKHNRHLFCCKLRHDLAVRSVAIEDAKEPIERLRLLREGLDHLERVLVYFGRQHLLVFLGLIF